MFAVKLDALDCADGVSSSYVMVGCRLHMCTKMGFISHSLYIVSWLAIVVCLPVVHLLELERQQHNQLKHTWQRANDQFLESQRLLMQDMQRIESVLSSEQLRQVEEMKKRDQVLLLFNELEALIESVLKAILNWGCLVGIKDLIGCTVS